MQADTAARPRVLVFGGTTEGREIVEWLSARGTCSIVISSLTEYGGSLVEGYDNVESLTGCMLPDAMKELMRERDFCCVVDATHPYAAGVSASIAGAAEECGVALVRILREGEPEGPWMSVGSADEAADYVASKSQAVLLTTGSNELPVYVNAMPDFAERLYARILPTSRSIAQTEELGMPPNHVIAMKGPFSKELNIALIREFGIGIVVTKASGKAGGFWEKVEAARESGAELVVIHRPTVEEGLSIEDAKRQLAEDFGV